MLDQVAGDQRDLLLLALPLRVFGEIAALGREADAEWRVRQRRDLGQDVRVLDEGDRRCSTVILLDLVLGSCLRPIVGDGGDADEDILRPSALHDFTMHVECTGDIDACHAARGWLADRPTDQGHLGARLARSAGDGKAHLAGREIGDAAHRVDRLEGRTGGDQHLLPGEQLRLQEGDQVFENLFRLQHAPVAGFAAGLFAAAGSEQRHAVDRQRRHVALRRGVFPHLLVHGRGSEQRTVAGEHHRRQQVVGEPVRDLGEEVGRGRRDQDQVCFP